MRLNDFMEVTPKLYSPFLPLQLLVLFVWGWTGYHIFALNGERLEVEAQIQQVVPRAESALNAKKGLLALAEDVGRLALKDPVAAQIVKEFDIRLQNPGNTEAAPSTK